jgi:thioredoxin-like negative regulator of GroEL
MWGPARLVALLAVAAATQVAAAAERFVPADPAFVVANVRQALPDEKLLPLLAAWRADTSAESTGAALAAAFMERARTLREPMYFGRAEAVLAPLVAKPGAGTAVRRLYAQALQHRHDFVAAETLLDAVLREAPHDDDARLLRASVRLVRGDFSGARSDCAQLAAGGGDAATPGFACFAQALAGGGNLERAKGVLDALPAGGSGHDAATRAYLLATRAELRERGRDLAGALLDYREALNLAPRDDSIRAALADALAANGNTGEASDLLAIDKPSLALLVRSVALSEGARRARLIERAESWFALEAARGDKPHLREAAMLALAMGDPARALSAARRNFEVQKELADVRVLARAARKANDAVALSALRSWLRETGYRDSITEGVLDESLRS